MFMNNIFQDMIDDIDDRHAGVYLDDILIFSDNSAHLNMLTHEVLSHLNKVWPLPQTREVHVHTNLYQVPWNYHHSRSCQDGPSQTLQESTTGLCLIQSSMSRPSWDSATFINVSSKIIYTLHTPCSNSPIRTHHFHGALLRGLHLEH